MGFFDELDDPAKPIRAVALSPLWDLAVRPLLNRAGPWWGAKVGEALQSPTAVSAAETFGKGATVHDIGSALSEVANQDLVGQDIAAERKAAAVRKITGQAPPWQAPQPKPAPAVTEPPPAPARTSTSVGAPYPETPTDLPGPPTLDVLDSQGNVIDPMSWKRSAYGMEQETKPRAGGAVDPNLGTGSFDVRPGPGGYSPSVQVPEAAGMNFDTFNNEVVRLGGINQLAKQTLIDRWNELHPQRQEDLEQRKGQAEIGLAEAQAEQARGLAEKAKRSELDEAINAMPRFEIVSDTIARQMGFDPELIKRSKIDLIDQTATQMARDQLKKRQTIPPTIEGSPQFNTLKQSFLGLAQGKVLADTIKGIQSGEAELLRGRGPVQYGY